MMSIGFDYTKLKARTVEMGKTDKAVAKAANMTPSTYSVKLNGRGEFDQSEIYDICKFLRIDLRDIPLYFLQLKFSFTEHKKER